MEKDQNIEKIIKEAGLIAAPEKFTDQVMNQINTEPSKALYKPLIGRLGRFLIILFVLGLVVITITYAQPGDKLINLQWQLPKVDLNMDFLTDMKIPVAFLAALGAFFILILSDANLGRRKLV